MRNNTSNISRAYIIWFLGALFFLLEYFIRVSPGVITKDLMHDLNIHAEMLGWLFAFFYYAYVLMQLPVGTLVDRFGPRRLLVGATIMCSFACFLFAIMPNIHVGLMSRALMGISASFAFVSTLKLVSIWFEPKRFALLAGVTQAMGMVGAILGNAPIAYLFNALGWRQSMGIVSLVFILLGILMFAVIRDQDPSKSNHAVDHENPIKILPNIKHVILNRNTMLNCLFIGLLFGPTASFGEQWGASFLSSAYGINNTTAGAEISAIFIGLAIGCPLMGWISDKLETRVQPMKVAALVCLVLLTSILYNQQLGLSFMQNPKARYAAFFVYGLFNSGIVASYAYASEINPHRLTGIALGVANMASVILGSVLLPIIGYILKWHQSLSASGTPIYSVHDYQIAFSALPVCLIIAFLISFTLKETHCSRVEDITN